MTSHESTEPEIDLVGCPECGAPAEVVDRFVLPSPGGPVEHVKVQCLSRRWFTVSVGRLSPVTGEESDRWASTPR